jgi:hypothetical protein
MSGVEEGGGEPSSGSTPDKAMAEALTSTVLSGKRHLLGDKELYAFRYEDQASSLRIFRKRWQACS